MLYWLLKYILLGPLLRVYNRPRVEGLENFPSTGPALLVSNHLSVADWLFTPLLSPRRVTFLAKSDYFERPGLYGRLQKFFFSGTGQYPINRANAEAAEAALVTGEEVLGRGDVLCIYVEGTRSPDGRLYRGKTGAARLALRAGVPVVPVGLIGTDRLKGRVIPRPTRVTVRFGRPLDLSDYEGKAGDREAERAMTNEMMSRIQELTGQEYIEHRYGKDVKNEYEARAKSGRNLLDDPAAE